MTYKRIVLFSTLLFSHLSEVLAECSTCSAKTSETIKRKFTIQDQAQLTISTDCTQHIRVHEGLQNNEISLTLIKRGPHNALENVHAQFKETPSHIGVELYNSKEHLGTISQLEVTVPRGTIVSCHCRGKTTLHGAITEAFVETLSETVTVKGISGTLDVRTDSGDIAIENTRGSIIAQTSSGQVSIDNAFESVHVTSSSGALYIRNPQKDVDVSTRSGSIFLEMASITPSQIIRTHTTSGDVSCALPKHEDPSIVVYQTTGNIHGGHFRYKHQRDSWLFGKPTPPLKEPHRALIYINAPTGNITFNIFEGVMCCQ